ncbi:MAG: hypothetical protein WBG86_17895 [Polyangiales bacterium]
MGDKSERIESPVDPILLRHLTSETPSVPVITATWSLPGWIIRGAFPDGRAWGVQPLLFERAALHVWRPGVTVKGMSDRVWQYNSPVVAILAAFEWEGIEDEPRWWERCDQTHRRRKYSADGSYVEEIRE